MYVTPGRQKSPTNRHVCDSIYHEVRRYIKIIRRTKISQQVRMYKIMCYRLPLTSPNSLFICPKVGNPRNQGKWPGVAKGLWRNQRVLDTVRSKFASLSHLENQIFRLIDGCLSLSSPKAVLSEIEQIIIRYQFITGIYRPSETRFRSQTFWLKSVEGKCSKKMY